MKLQFPLIVGLLAGSLMALPVEANNGYRGDSFVIAKRGADEGERSTQRSDERRDNRRVRRPSDDRSYGYGYERRQRQPEASPPPADDRSDERRKKGYRR